jgi:GMP reductase
MEFIEIESIEKINYFGEVIDLSIEDDESYNIENIIVHNSACTTWPSTGFGSRNCQASTVYECSLVATKPIVADGGIRVPGDISKSLVLGATMVMIGGMMSGFKDSPGHLVDVNGTIKKEFWGSASKFQSGKTNRIEGKKLLIDYKDRSILDEMKYIEECLQSSISYAGGKDLSAFNTVKWI